jgi:puromycin-sensitive aminopeptidase
MEWWTDLWLNEGFAEFVTFLCISNLFEKYDVWSQFLSMILSRAMKEDSLANSHPIEVAVTHPSEIDEIFDSISYCKGASVLRMLYNHIGDADFRKGMNLYLTRHSYANAQTSDLWKALGEVTSQPIEAMMSTWTKQMGYPLVSVAIAKGPDGSRVLKLKQEKFTFKKGDDTVSYKWLIPISLSSSDDPSLGFHKKLFDGEKETEIEIKIDVGGKEMEWIKVLPCQFTNTTEVHKLTVVLILLRLSIIALLDIEMLR